MSSPPPHMAAPAPVEDQDDPMAGGASAAEDEEGEGDDIAPGAITDDSSEEEEDDEEEEKRIREGFIVDEEDEDDAEERKRKRRKRRKKHHRKREEEEEEGLEDDDLELLEENTGGRFSKTRLTRLRRGHDSQSPPIASTSKRKNIIEEDSSDDDLDMGDLPQVQDIQRIFEDERGGRDEEEDVDMDDMDNFIDYDDDDDHTGQMDEREREERRKERRALEKSRRKAMGGRPELAGIDANAWAEIHDVFGDGHEYDWALVGDDDPEYVEERLKPEMRYQDVFEPSEIRSRMLTDDDDLIRAQDIPERMQLSTSSLSSQCTLSTHKALTEADLGDAAMWVTTRLSHNKTREFFQPEGKMTHLAQALVLAVSYALRYMFIHEFEVPYIWVHKRDYISHFDPSDVRARVELLTLSELWRIYTLGQKYRSLVERRNALDAAYGRLKISDSYYQDDIRPSIDAVEVVADATEWLAVVYKDKKDESGGGSSFEFHFHDDEDTETAPEQKKRKLPSRISAYELAKKSIISRLANGYGLGPTQIVQNFVANNNSHFVEDHELPPMAFAEQFTDMDDTSGLSAESILSRARMILATELGKDPLLRKELRQVFKQESRITVEPTEQGKKKIDEHHAYSNFKYLLNKPIHEMIIPESAQFLNILAAESEGLVTVKVDLEPDAQAQFERRLNDAWASDSFSDTAKAWNAERALVTEETLKTHLLPMGAKWAREWIREEVEDNLAARCGARLKERVDVAPFITQDMRLGDTASVLAVSWGKGDPQKDAITLIFLDEDGRLREHSKVDNLYDADYKEEFLDIIRRRRPDVIVIAGFSMVTTKLSQRIKEILGGNPEPGEVQGNWETFDIPVVYVRDDVARIYQHSKRAAAEFSALSPVAKHCVGLARYTQSPLNEFAALGTDITAITFEDEDQHLLPQEKLLTALERALVDVTNKVGVDVNRAISDGYYQHLLPFVCGLGPRKAQVLVQKIGAAGGHLVNRDQFIKVGILTTKIFLNAAGFLRISQELESKSNKNRHGDDEVQDPLDDTRIHPEDYELARKMATDALELDEEDIHDEHPSHVVSVIMHDDDNEKKLSELNLDEFAVNMYEANEDRKRHTLNVIRDELLRPFAELRAPYRHLLPWEVLTMLSGESERTLRVGLIVSVLVVRINKEQVAVRLDSGIDGVINLAYLTDDAGKTPKEVVAKGQTVSAVIIDLQMNVEADRFSVELSSRSGDVGGGDSQFREVRKDEYWNHNLYAREVELAARKKRAATDKSRRVIQHPNFYDFNTLQAEQFLDKQQRGDVVIRPSSKGFNHLAVTWKVDDNLYQHIDVTEMTEDDFKLGKTSHAGELMIDPMHKYSDLDELVVNHVQAIARKVEELMAHDKYKPGTEDDLHLFLKNFVAANPAKSMYGFTLNRKRAGHFSLCFLANKNATVQTWPVRVTPEAYYLFDAAAGGVPELCDAFKVRHLHATNLGGGAGGKTPFGAGAGGRTPARTPGHRTPGHATPGHMSVRQAARTPNPYGGATPGRVPGASTYAPSATPAYGMPPPASFGYQTPSAYPPRTPAYAPPTSNVPAGMNPARAAMINAQGWGQPPSSGR